MNTTNAKGEPFNVCTTCEPNHVDNCRTCNGFGVQLGNGLPLSAADVVADADWIACPECGGTPAGIPKQLVNELALERFGKSMMVVQCQCEELRVSLGNLAAAFSALPTGLQNHLFPPSFHIPIHVPSQWSIGGVVPHVTTLRNYPEQGDKWVMVRGTNAAAEE